MDCTINGKLKIWADEETIERLEEVFSDGDDELDEYSFEEVQGEVYEVEVGEDQESIEIPFEESTELFRTTDTSKDIMNFVVYLKESFPAISSFVFKGTMDFWSSGEHSKFECGFDGSKATIKECDYDEYFIDEKSNYLEILKSFGWSADNISEEFINKNRGKTLCARNYKSVESEEDLVEAPADYWYMRTDLIKILEEKFK